MSDEKRARDSGLQGDPESPDAAVPKSAGGEERRDRPPSAGAGNAPSAGGNEASSAGSSSEHRAAEIPERRREDGVYFFPEEAVTATEVRSLIESGTRDEKARVVSHLLTYAEYAEIWTWVDRDLVRDLFDELQLPDRLRTAWARNLGLVTKTG